MRSRRGTYAAEAAEEEVSEEVEDWAAAVEVVGRYPSNN
jgi:hypothetical protein